MGVLIEVAEVGDRLTVNGIVIEVVAIQDGIVHLGLSDDVKDDVILGEELQEA